MEFAAIMLTIIFLAITIGMLVKLYTDDISLGKVILCVVFFVLVAACIYFTIYLFTNNGTGEKQDRWIANVYQDMKFDKPKLIIKTYMQHKEWSMLGETNVRIEIKDDISDYIQSNKGDTHAAD